MMKTARNWIPTWYNLIMLVIMLFNCYTTGVNSDNVNTLETGYHEMFRKYGKLEKDYIKSLELNNLLMRLTFNQEKIMYLMAIKVTLPQAYELKALCAREDTLIDSLKYYR